MLCTIQSIGLALVVWLLTVAFPCSAALRIKSKHDKVSLGEKEYLILSPQQMLTIELRGPTHLGLRLRQITPKQPVPVDLTVVKDDREQGTVRIDLHRGNKYPGYSEQVIVKIEVPRGKHFYRILISGASKGVVLFPYRGSIRSRKNTIIATPPNAIQTATSNAPAANQTAAKPTKNKAPKPKLPALSEPDILQTIAITKRARVKPVTYTIVHTPPARVLDVGFRTSSSIAALFFTSASALLVSSQIQARRAKAEQIQIAASIYYERAKRTQTASLVAYGVASAALVSTIVFYLLTDRSDPFLGFRF